jgi:hypothetical protein
MMMAFAPCCESDNQGNQIVSLSFGAKRGIYAERFGGVEEFYERELVHGNIRRGSDASGSGSFTTYAPIE